MDQTSHLFFCSVCKEKFKFESVRYCNDGKNLVCLGCMEKIAKKELKEKSKNGKIIETDIKPDRVRLICVDCRYKFSFNKKTKVDVRCPYCGKNRLMVDNTTAQRVIDEVSKPNYREL